MIKTKLTWTIKEIQKMYKEKETLAFDHPIQRQANQWSNRQMSLLIHSILSNYPIPNVYVLREDSNQLDEKNKPIYNFSVLDGKQRLTNVLSFLAGEYPLDDSLPSVEMDGTTYEIAGRYFCDLDEPLRYEILRFKFDIFSFENCINNEVEEIFFRLNNSVPLTKSQVAKAKMGTDMASFMNELLISRFISESANFSSAQRKANDDQKCIIQAMMLLDREYVENFRFADFSENTIMEYSSNLKGEYSIKQQNIMVSAIEFLDNAFPAKNKDLRKITIPMLIFIADFAMDNEIKPIYFRQWFEYYVHEDNLQEVYKTYCSTGSTKLDKVNGRLKVLMQSFCRYFEKNLPEEYQDEDTEKVFLEDVQELVSEGTIEMETVDELIESSIQEENEVSTGECDPELGLTDSCNIEIEVENAENTEFEFYEQNLEGKHAN